MEIKLLTYDAKMPTKATDGSAGYDLYASSRSYLDPITSTVVINTGVAIWIEDPNIVGLIFPRSGLSIKTHTRLWNTVGVIDSDYQGEIILYMSAEDMFYAGDCATNQERVAQILFMPIVHPMFESVLHFSKETERNTNGFGSTGNE